MIPRVLSELLLLQGPIISCLFVTPETFRTKYKSRTVSSDKIKRTVSVGKTGVKINRLTSNQFYKRFDLTVGQ